MTTLQIIAYMHHLDCFFVGFSEFLVRDFETDDERMAFALGLFNGTRHDSDKLTPLRFLGKI